MHSVAVLKTKHNLVRTFRVLRVESSVFLRVLEVMVWGWG